MKKYNIPFYIGDYFKIIHSGGCYSSNVGAFKHFGILNKTKEGRYGFASLNLPLNFKDLIWRLVNIAEHQYVDTYIGHFKSNEGHDICYTLTTRKDRLLKINTEKTIEEHNKRLTEKLEIKRLKNE